jgi:hypothetical protein
MKKMIRDRSKVKISIEEFDRKEIQDNQTIYFTIGKYNHISAYVAPIS